MPTYNPQYDYISAHLDFVSKHKTFQPRGILLSDCTYLQMLTEQYKIESFSDTPLDVIRERKNKLAYECYRLDIVWQDASRVIGDSLRTTNSSDIVISFITIGFNHQTFNPRLGYEFVKTVLGLSIILDGSFGVMEIHRENGLHPHVHFKIYHNKKSTKGTLIQTIFRAKGARSLLLGRNFIDVKSFHDNHDNYLNGDKTETKMKYVEQDIVWRNKNGIPEKVFKDNI